MITRLVFIGDGSLRYGNDTVERPCWQAFNRHDKHVADVFEASKGCFELWCEGELYDGGSVEACVRSFSMALAITPADAIHRLALRGDGLEVSPVRHDPVSDTCEVVDDPNDATMWSVYVHRNGHGVMCVADWRDCTQAETHARELLAAYPNLAKHGINNGSVVA